VKTLSVGTYRRLMQCSTRRGAISVLALDHRNNLRTAMRPDNPQSVTDEELIAFKRQVIGVLSPKATAVLLDAEYGAAQCVVSGSLPGNIGQLVAIEATGYTGDPLARQSQILPDWGVDKISRMGASAAKLLVYYHPDAAAAAEMEALVCKVAEDCAKYDMPLFLESLSYSLDPNVKQLAPDERRYVVIETARRLTPLGATVFKAEFPVDIKSVINEQDWLGACYELTAASAIPWVLLSASVDYEVFLRQVAAACSAGATGVAVGRAVWKEAVSLQDAERLRFLVETARGRMERITSLVDALGRSWNEYYAAPEAPSDWYKGYAGV
jgi:tagatose 1,6-diphosphate aldolase